MEAAWLVAKAGEREAPPVPAPRLLRPVLRHARLTSAALSVIRRVVDEDEAFRVRVADLIDEESVGRAGWLFLARPEGWEQELAGLGAAEAAAAADAASARDERAASRRLRGAEEARRRAEGALAEAQAAAARAAEEVARERSARREAEAEVAGLRDRLSSAEAALASASARVDDLERQVRERPPPVRVAVVPADAVEAVARAAEAMDAAGAALAEASAALAGPGAASVAGVDVGGADEAEGVAAPDDAIGRTPATPDRPARRGTQKAARRGRRAAPMPPAVFDDSDEAAEHLVRLPGALLLVDGYNASLAYRPDLPIAELRRRLVDAVDELVARTGIEATIVFDGAEVDDDRPARTGGRRRSARVTFSPPDMEADDLILELVDAAPATRPVVVASDDRRVQDGARVRGANVLSTAQLLAALRRER